MHLATAESARATLATIAGAEITAPITDATPLASLGITQQKLRAFDFSTLAPVGKVPARIWPLAFSSWHTVGQARSAINSLTKE